MNELAGPDVGPVATLAPICILAGGLGSRLSELALATPKALVEIAGEPFLFHQLRLLRCHGADRVVLCIGHLGEQIEAAVGDGARFGLRVDYVYDGAERAGTGGAVRRALPVLGEEFFFVLYGDTYLRIDYHGVQEAFRVSGLPGLMTVLRNEGRWDRSNAVYADRRVTRYDKEHPTPDMLWIDYGLGVLTPEALAVAGAHSDLAAIYRALAERALLAGYEATERFYEIGTPLALRETDAFLRALRVPGSG